MCLDITFSKLMPYLPRANELNGWYPIKNAFNSRRGLHPNKALQYIYISISYCLPTRFANRSCSLIDQVYCKLPLPADAVSSRIVVTQLSDHLPCITSIKTLQSKHRHPKFVTIRTNSREAIARFKNEIEISNLSRRLNPNLMTDPNLTYNLLEDAILSARDKHMPKRNVRFNKYKHKMNKWVTTGILKSIRYRDSLYKKLKSTPYNCEQHMTLKLNLKTYNYILNKTIRTAKKEYYFTEFSKYKHDIRKTWGHNKGSYM